MDSFLWIIGPNWFWSIIGLIGLVLIPVVIVWRGMQMTKLIYDGVAAEGTVIKKFRSGGGQTMSTLYLRYEYWGPDGQRYEYKIGTEDEFWQAHEVGDKIELVYVRSKPSISGHREMVNRGRELAKLPPL